MDTPEKTEGTFLEQQKNSMEGFKMPRKYYDDRFEKKQVLEPLDCRGDAQINGAAACPKNEPDEQSGRQQSRGQQLPKYFVRYDEGAQLYSMSVHTFMRLAADAKAVYKVNRVSLVNTKVFEEYLETFRVL